MADIRRIYQAQIISFAEQVEQEFLRLYQAYDVAAAPERRKADIIDSFWTDIYKLVFKPDLNEISYNNCKSKLLAYKVDDMEDVVNIYINLCRRYGGVIKFNSFCELTGYHRYTLDLWSKCNHGNGYIFTMSDNDLKSELNNIYIIYNNGVVEYHGNSDKDSEGMRTGLSSTRFDVKKKLREAMQDGNTNGLSNDTMGHAMRANNEDELGKLYEPRRMVQQEQIKRVLSVSELPKLADFERINDNDS